jgi:putative methyltransferase (TIGR04325 family)
MEKIYSSYHSALADCHNSGYNSELLAAVVSQKTSRFAKELQQTRKLDLTALRSMIFLGAIQPCNRDTLRVLDFGGACGYHYLIAKALQPTLNYDWRVVESEAMAEAGTKDHQTDELSFFPSISACVREDWLPEVIFASSSLQYVPDPNYTVSELLNIGSELCYITRTPLSDFDQSLVTIQKSALSNNGPGALPQGFTDQIVTYPITFFPIKDLLVTARSLGYAVRISVEEERASLAYNGVSINHHRTIIFSKIFLENSHTG